jgi:hypothetical protein
MDDTEYLDEEFLQKVGDQVLDRIAIKGGWRGFSTNLRGNVIEIPMKGIEACHYEIGLHEDCHEIALHFQSSKPGVNISRLNGFSPYTTKLKTRLGYPIILGPHEHTGRKRLWIKLPLSPLSQELLEKYSELMSDLIVETFPILRSILEQERKIDSW